MTPPNERNEGVSRELVVIGIGTEFRGDDAAGLAVLRALRSIELPDFVRLAECSGDGIELMNLWAGADRVLLVDCVSAKIPPGSILTLDLLHEPPPPHWRTSTHTMGVSEAVALARSIGSLPSSLTLYGIQGAAFEQGRGLSPTVRIAVERVAVLIELELLSELSRI